MSKYLSFIPKLFPILFCLLLLLLLYNYTNRQEEVVFTTQENTVKEVVEDTGESLGKPTRITIDSVNIDLEIREGSYDYTDRSWTLTKYYAYWANLSDEIYSTHSSTTIYAHNQKTEFYNLKYINKGDRIKIVTDKGNEIYFTYQYTEIVLPDKSSVIFDKEEKSRLVLITCDGIWSQSRRILYTTLD